MTAGNDDLWAAALIELRLQTTTATFNTWFVGSQQVSADGRELVVAVRNSYAVDWLQHRMYDVVKRSVTAVAGKEYDVVFVEQRAPAEIVELELVSPPSPPVFPGFEPIRSNFTQVPRQFFEVVIRSEPSVVTAFVAAVIDQTYGVIVNYHTSERREWWTASYAEIGLACGIRSRASVTKAVMLARKNGYVIRNMMGANCRYRLRRIGEKVDWE